MRRSLIALLVLVGACGGRRTDKIVRVAAAADLRSAFEELGKEFETRTGIHPEFTFGSSGLLAHQIAEGGTYYMFAAANKQYVDEVVKAQRCDAASVQLYARGRLVVWTPKGVDPPRVLGDLAQERFKRIAIANPDHAPYGVAAVQALKKAGVWDAVEKRIVHGDNVSHAMLYAREDNAEAAIVALSLVSIPNGGDSLAIDPSPHEPLDQQLVVCGAGEESDRARQLVDFINSRDGREVMTRYGFLLPDEKAATK